MSELVRLGLAVEDMSRHMSNEGWEIFRGLQHNGYILCGYNLPPNDETSVPFLLDKFNPNIVVIQDRREWDRRSREPRAEFRRAGSLKFHRCTKLTILKDAHQRGEYHQAAAQEMGIDAHIIYYDEQEVRKQAPWLTGEVIRTYHSVDADIVPPYADRSGFALLSGAVSNAYPFRKKLIDNYHLLSRRAIYVRHPGYHNRGSTTPAYLKMLSQFRVAICTCSIYKYTLRRMIEATACGCVVLTNLPHECWLPEIDENLVRINSESSVEQVGQVIKDLCHSYDPGRQEFFATHAKEHYDYRAVTRRLVQDIDDFYYERRLRSANP